MAETKTTAKKASVFETLNAINCNEHTEKKNGLTYLSWAWAWAEVKKAYPASFYTIYEAANGWNYHTDGRTCWVKTGVTIEGLEHIEYLPVMDARNRSIPADAVTSFDVNKAIQRSLTKACARHGLGLYIYAGEDLPETDQQAAAGKPADTGYYPVDNETYWKYIEAFATGRLSKSGRTCDVVWKEKTGAGPEQVAKFYHDAENYKIAHNTK